MWHIDCVLFSAILCSVVYCYIFRCLKILIQRRAKMLSAIKLFYCLCFYYFSAIISASSSSTFIRATCCPPNQSLLRTYMYDVIFYKFNYKILVSLQLIRSWTCDCVAACTYMTTSRVFICAYFFYFIDVVSV